MYRLNVLTAFEESRTVYYLGWIIQPTLDGFIVSDRNDRDIIGMNKNSSCFVTIEEALEYVDTHI